MFSIKHLAIDSPSCTQAMRTAGAVALATAAKQAFAGHEGVQKYSAMLIGKLG